MARITKKYTMGWYGGCNCKDISVSEIGGTIGDSTFGKLSFVTTDAQGTSYFSNRNSSRVGRLVCGVFYIVTNETVPLQEIDIPDFHILSSDGKDLSECCDKVVVYGIDIVSIDIDDGKIENVTLDVALENVVAWKYSLNGGEQVSVDTGTRATFQAPPGRHTLTVFGLDNNGNVVDEETKFFEVTIPTPTPTPEPNLPCCHGFKYTHTESTSEEELGDLYDPEKLQTGKEYGYVELQKATGPFSSIKPNLSIATMCHNGAFSSDPMPPLDIQSIQNFENDGYFNQNDFEFKHGEIAFGRQYYGKIRVTLNNGDCYEGCVCTEYSEVNLVPVGEHLDCICGG